MKGITLWILLAGGAASLWQAAKLLRPGKHAVQQEQARSTTLAELSSIWTGDEDVEIIDLAELSRNWRNEVPAPETHPPRPEPLYRHPEIGEFHSEMVAGRPFMIQNIKACIEELLDLLDDGGDCPSVVKRNRKEAEAGLAPNVFDMLATVPLYRHSLNVAREIATLCTQKVVVPKAVIAALAHDLGKLPSYQHSLYATGDHPYIASIVLGNISTFQELAYADEVIEAVRQHHRPEPELELARKLKTADQASRSREIAAMMAPSRDEAAGTDDLPEEVPENDKTENPLAETETAKEKTRAGIHGEETAAGNEILRQAGDTDPDIFGSGEGRKEKVCNQRVPVEWFEPSAALEFLKQHLNRLKGGRLTAFSMPDGYVYVQVYFFWQMAKRLSKNRPELLAADADIQARRNIMFTLVERLDKESGAIARELLGEGFYMAKFILNPDTDSPQETSCVPFRAEAFGVPLNLLEARKVTRIREIVKVIPRHLLGKDGSEL